MSKALVISDVHIHDWPQRNPSEKYRLYQNRIVAQNIIQAGKAEGCDILIIAGDLLEKSIIRPYIQAEVKNFLDTLMSNFSIGYIIWGNHDQDNKSNDQDFIDSCLSVMLPSNLYYADKRETVIDNTRIAFYNWRPDFDLSWINGTVDILITHATISYSKDDMLISQKLDESKFNLAICGDIHKPASVGKYVSIGIPQRCKISDSEYQTGVVIDFVQKNYKWVNLNPNDNLMKFQYTDKRENEGWDSTTGIWSVYKSEIYNLNKSEIKVPAWQEIDKLIKDIITANNLQVVHSNVLSNMRKIDSKEVDFNFTLTRFYCKNWRSIEEAELKFNGNDKILITGENGSGKSSLLTAIKYAFLENRSIKDFIKFGTKECITEVEFIYQGTNYKIQRGSKRYGFWIEGEIQKYNNKSEFEKDMKQRFQFIDYMDVYFFDSDHHKLIGGISPERKSDIISKFFKLEKIDSYYSTALELLNQINSKNKQWVDLKSQEEKLLVFIDDKIKSIKIPSIEENELLKLKSDGIALKNKYNLYINYKNKLASLETLEEYLSSNMETLKNKISNFRDVSIIIEEKEKLENLKQRINDLYHELFLLKIEGNKVFEDKVNLTTTKVCPTCGQSLKRNHVSSDIIVELDRKIDELTKKQEEIYNKFYSNFGISREVLDSKPSYDSRIRDIDSDIVRLSTELNNQNLIKEELIKYTNQLEQVKIQMNEMGHGNLPEKIELPIDFEESMHKIDLDLLVWKEIKDLQKDKEEHTKLIESYNNKLLSLQNEITDIEDYVKLTSPTGKIYEEIMTRFAKQFTDNTVKYEVMLYKFRNKDYLDLASYFINNNGDCVSYQACSSGQQTILDVNFLSKVVTGMGLLVMDEFLKHLDPYSHDLCLDCISHMNIGCIMISSHMESITAFNNRSLKMTLSGGKTNITFK